LEVILNPPYTLLKEINMAFDWPKVHKWEDNLIDTATEWVTEYITEFYGVDEISELTEEQIDEIIQFRENDLNEYSPLQMGFSNIISYWEG
jgi:hypothetical protein